MLKNGLTLWWHQIRFGNSTVRQSGAIFNNRPSHRKSRFFICILFGISLKFFAKASPQHLRVQMSVHCGVYLEYTFIVYCFSISHADWMQPAMWVVWLFNGSMNDCHPVVIDFVYFSCMWVCGEGEPSPGRCRRQKWKLLLDQNGNDIIYLAANLLLFSLCAARHFCESVARYRLRIFFPRFTFGPPIAISNAFQNGIYLCSLSFRFAVSLRLSFGPR